MSRRVAQQAISRKPLLSIDEAAVLLGESRSTIYRSLKRGDLPLPVFTINGRHRIPRRAVERLLEGSDPCADLIARMTSQTSGPPARAARRPVGPARKTIPGCSVIRKASSTRRLAADDNDMPGFAETKDASLSATSGSNLTGVGDFLAMTTS